ncbi:MAG: CDP-alcohol phosphatidyltransferase family protein [Candidatus Omnitrophica bacterium]|nr:CDP-alcohol phosphatidyltransferase family protein [Candidatus Omnitrophota bacterium]
MPLTLANRLTIGRLLMVPFFIVAVLYYSPDNDYTRFIALGIFLAAVILDVLDGYVARKFDQETKAGAILDPLADKILLISAYICIYKVSVLFNTVRFPIWLVVAVISRDVILLLGFVVIHLFNGNISVNPTIWGKATVFFQILAVIGILMQWQLFSLFWYVILILVVISGIDYILKGIKELNSGANV